MSLPSDPFDVMVEIALAERRTDHRLGLSMQPRPPVHPVPDPVECSRCGHTVNPVLQDAGFAGAVWVVPVDESARCPDCAWMEL